MFSGISDRRIKTLIQKIECITKIKKNEYVPDKFFRGQLDVLEHALVDWNKVHLGERWGYVPACSREFFQILQYVRKLNPKLSSFLELGSAIGTKLYIANKWLSFKKVTGIEINKKYCKLSKKLLPKATILNEDILESNIIHEYDVVYSYIPIRGEGKEFDRKFIKFVIDKMKDNSFFVFKGVVVPFVVINKISKTKINEISFAGGIQVQKYKV